MRLAMRGQGRVASSRLEPEPVVVPWEGSGPAAEAWEAVGGEALSEMPLHQPPLLPLLRGQGREGLTGGA